MIWIVEARLGGHAMTMRHCIMVILFALFRMPGAVAIDYGCDREVPALPSWNDTATKTAVIDFLRRVTTPGGPEFVPEPERSAVFDNDGTLWAEQPLYAQIYFTLDRIKELAPDHPEWWTREPFSSVLAGDVKAVLRGGEKAIVTLAMAACSGVTTDEFCHIAADWLATARNPETGRPFTAMAYQPMLELMELLRGEGFKVYIVTGGDTDLVRAYSEKVYGVPPENVIGTAMKTAWEADMGAPRILRLPELYFEDNGEGKPLEIQRRIGRRPLLAAGNSDGDLEMLQWTMAGHGARLALLVHHTDTAREWSYDRDSAIGTLDKALDMAKRSGWTIIDMREDWKRIYPPQ